MSVSSYRRRRSAWLLMTLCVALAAILLRPDFYETQPSPQLVGQIQSALKDLEEVPVKGRAPKTGYSREQFGDGWATKGGCDTRNIILYHDLKNTIVNDECKVLTGMLVDPYTGKTIAFTRGTDTSDDVQIDHVVAVSNAWQTGAQQLTYEQRVKFYNDSLNLLAVDGAANQQKGDGDAATWLPKNKAFRCQYVSRQISVKKKYDLWVVPPEKAAMERILRSC